MATIKSWRPTVTLLTLLTLIIAALSILLTTPPPYLPKTSPSLSLFPTHALNNTIAIIPINTGMLHLADNLLCSLQRTTFNTSNLVFWSLDLEAKRILEGQGFAAYHDPTLFATSGNENSRGVTRAYKRMMQERPKFFLDVLSTGVDVLMLDADTVFWQSPLSIKPDDASVDIVYSTDAREFYQEHDAFRDLRRRGEKMPPICNGIFWMKSNEATISLWKEMLAVFRIPWPFGLIWQRLRGFQDDQRGMDVLLNDGRARVVEPLPRGLMQEQLPEVTGQESLNVVLLDQTQVTNGHLLQNRQGDRKRYLEELRAEGMDWIGAHFNWDTRMISKEEGARALGMWFLDEMGGCTLA